MTIVDVRPQTAHENGSGRASSSNAEDHMDEKADASGDKGSDGTQDKDVVRPSQLDPAVWQDALHEPHRPTASAIRRTASRCNSGTRCRYKSAVTREVE